MDQYIKDIVEILTIDRTEEIWLYTKLQSVKLTCSKQDDLWYHASKFQEKYTLYKIFKSWRDVNTYSKYDNWCLENDRN